MPHTDTIPVSASIASTGTGIRYIGEHCYAYNTATMLNSANTVLSFTTGSGYIKGVIELTGPISFDVNVGSGGVVGLRIKFNEIVITYIKADSEHEDQQTPSNFTIIIPPFTKVDCAFLNVSTSGDYTQSVSLTGRVYGAE